MNRPATKLATKGTLDTRATIPKGVIMPRTFDMFADIESKFTLRFPVYAIAIMMNATTTIAIAMLEIFLNSFPEK